MRYPPYKLQRKLGGRGGEVGGDLTSKGNESVCVKNRLYVYIGVVVPGLRMKYAWRESPFLRRVGGGIGTGE